MVNFVRKYGLAMAVLVAVLALSGCYTQVGPVRGDRDYDYGYRDQDQGAVTDTTYEQPGDSSDYDYQNDRGRFYFDYYYPSFTFGLGYYDSWWRPWWAWGSWYYDPFYYGSYYSPWGWGYGGYTPGWWYPHYGAYGPRYYGYAGRTRTFGNSRMVGATRGVYNNPGGGVMPGGIRSSAGGGSRTGVTTRRAPAAGPSARPSTRVAPGRRSDFNGRYVPPGSSGSVNRGSRGEGRRQYAQPRYAPAPRSEGRSGGRSYSPAPSAPSHSAPPPSRGGGGGGSRGGGGGGGGERHGGGRR